MNTNELRLELYNANYPPMFEVDRETYELVEKEVLVWLEEKGYDPILICGPHGGIMFKNVELIIK